MEHLTIKLWLWSIDGLYPMLLPTRDTPWWYYLSRDDYGLIKAQGWTDRDLRLEGCIIVSFGSRNLYRAVTVTQSFQHPRAEANCRQAGHKLMRFLEPLQDGDITPES